MKISQVIGALLAAKAVFGDVDVRLMDEETGNLWNVAEILKIYSRGHNGCSDRNKTVSAVAMVRVGGFPDNLVIRKRDGG